jgi:hypothetical protein
MAHKITARDCVTTVAPTWHGFETIQEIITRANSGICYEMEMAPLCYIAGYIDGKPQYAPSDSKILIAKDDNLPIGGAVNDSYSLISNNQIWDILENSLVGIQHQIVSAGTVDNRQKGFISVKLGEDVIKMAGRETESVFNFMFGHGGKLGVHAKSGFTIQVCHNTLMAALREKNEKGITLSIKHSKFAQDRIPEMEKAIAAHFYTTEVYKNRMDALAAEKCTEVKAREIFAGLLAQTTGEQKGMLSTRGQNITERLVELFHKGAGNDGNDYSDVLGSITDFYTHESAGGENKWKQNVSSEFGSAAKAKDDFFRLIGGTVADDEKERKAAKVELAEVCRIGRGALAAV